MGRRQGGESNENGGRVLDGVCLGGPAGGGAVKALDARECNDVKSFKRKQRQQRQGHRIVYSPKACPRPLFPRCCSSFLFLPFPLATYTTNTRAPSV